MVCIRMESKGKLLLHLGFLEGFKELGLNWIYVAVFQKVKGCWYEPYLSLQSLLLWFGSPMPFFLFLSFFLRAHVSRGGADR